MPEQQITVPPQGGRSGVLRPVQGKDADYAERRADHRTVAGSKADEHRSLIEDIKANYESIIESIRESLENINKMTKV